MGVPNLANLMLMKQLPRSPELNGQWYCQKMPKILNWLERSSLGRTWIGILDQSKRRNVALLSELSYNVTRFR